MRGAKILLVSALVIAVIAGATVWWLGRGDDPPPLSLDDAPAAAEDASPLAPADLDGTWSVAPGSASQAGLRIEEDRSAGLPDNTAVGRTEDVSGTLVVRDGTVTEARFEVDLSTLEFSDDPGIPVADRSEYLRTRALETDRFPTASFVLTEPIEVPSDLLDGARTSVSATGALTLHGVEASTTLDLDVEVVGDEVRLATREPVTVRLADHDIEPPVIEGVSEVAPEGSFELLVVLARD